MVHERARRSKMQGLAVLLAPLAICLLVIAVVSTRIMAPARTVDDPLLDFAMGRGAPPPERGDKLRQQMATLGRGRGNNAPSTREGTGMTKERGWVPPGLDDDTPPRYRKSADEEEEDGDIESADASADEATGEEIESEGEDEVDEEDVTEVEDTDDDDEEEEEEPSRGREMSEDSGVGEELPPSRDEEIEAEIAEEEEGRADDDDDYDPLRPRKNPRGKRWRGWPNARRPVDKLGARTKRNAKGGKDREGAAKRNDSNRDPPNLPRSTGNDWWRKSSLCFEVDYICHGQEKNQWFYYAFPSESDDTDETPFQPTMELKSAPAKYDGGKDRGETRISIKVSSSSKVDLGETNFRETERSFLKSNKKGSDSKCEISSAPTHIVLQSLFNDMVGEFYSRTLLRLYNFMTDGLGRIETGGKLPWEENVQFYVHIPYGNKKIVDGHKLLLSGMLSDPESPVAKSLVDLFVQEENANGSSSSDCQCYEKMVFCGYDIYTHPARTLEPAVDDDDDVSAEQNSEPGDASGEDVKYTLWSAGKLDHSSELDAGSCGRNSGEKGTEYECQEWRGLRDFLSTNFAKHYPTLDRDIAAHRRHQLLKVGAIGADYEGDTKEFTVIGLTQRTYRRAWVNLPQIIEECNAASFERVICVEVNVEKTTTPFEQLLLHRSLDVMIGVHGAQMTQAILLPQHAHVLELLPWITDYIRGKWVQTTHGPTPLGVIFHNTDLNHAGYSLDRSSVPLCEGVPEGAEQTCFMRQRKKFIWENRDFTVESAAVMHYIDQFVLFVRDKQRPCDELKHRLDERFVLYNVWCTKPELWYPMERDGEQACVYGADYPIDHTDELVKGTHLFDSRSKCCSANPAACLSHAKSPKLGSSGNTFGVFHAYRKLPPKQKAKNVLTKMRRGRKKRIRNQ
ncbi:hypothetical protein ACHAXT_003384 [Thalassiosira profunda]